MIDQMKAVSAQDLPEELTVYTAETKDADGVRMITSTADIGDLPRWAWCWIPPPFRRTS